jgi:nucleotide-binding universal stress UspA family protein
VWPGRGEAGEAENVGLRAGNVYGFQTDTYRCRRRTHFTHAAERGIRLARSLGAEVAFVHTIEPALTYSPGITRRELVAQAEHDAKTVLASFRSLSQGLSTLECVQIGKPAQQTLNAARTWSADLIVMGNHGRHGVSRALLGSVAEAVMRHGPCPVLLIRAESR